MAWKRSILLFGLPLAYAAPAHTAAEEGNVVGNWEEVVESIPGRLHESFQEAFEYGRHAVEAMRSEGSALAKAGMDLAEQDAMVKDSLRKRQETNATVTRTVGTTTITGSETPDSTTEVSSTPSSTIPTTSTSEPATTQASSTVPPSSTSSAEPTSTSTSQGQTSTTSVVVSSASTGLSSASSSQEQDSSSVVIEPTTPTTTTVVPTTTVAPPPSTTAPTTTAPAPTTEQSTSNPPTTQAPAPTTRETSQAPTPTSTTNVLVGSDGSIITSVPPLATATDSDGDTVVLTSPTPGAIFTTSDQGGSVAIVTYTPGGGTVSQVRYRTTTLPNGSQSTVTSFATVGAPVTTSDESSEDPQQTDNATLQNGAARPSTWYSGEIALVFGAAIGVAGIFL